MASVFKIKISKSFLKNKNTEILFVFDILLRRILLVAQQLAFYNH